MMFIPDDSFKAKILQELEGGEKSISTLHRTLTEQGHKVHRLVLTGYLKAMEEMGVLSSREFPPSKVYSISVAGDKDIYETVMEISMKPEIIPESQRSEIVLYFFQKLFKRPIFRSELARAGLTSPPESFAMDLPGDERLELKRTLAKRGVKLPMKEQAYFLKDANFDKEYEIILQLALLNKFRASSLALDTKQTKLGV
jgi:DNA-binding HxlR family transcriptional regulator